MQVAEELYGFTERSGNTKIGGIPVSTSPRATCPGSCPLKGDQGCYAEDFHMRMAWDKVSHRTGKNLVTWEGLCFRVKALFPGTLWRHNQAGDLPNERTDNEAISLEKVRELTKANKGRKGFTYTHKSPYHGQNALAIKEANEGGFTVNLSADSLEEADRFASLGIGPVAVTVPLDHPKVSFTPEGRKVLVCVKQTAGIPCSNCKICAKADRGMIIAFRAHGNKARKLDATLRVIN